MKSGGRIDNEFNDGLVEATFPSKWATLEWNARNAEMGGRIGKEEECLLEGNLGRIKLELGTGGE